MQTKYPNDEAPPQCPFHTTAESLIDVVVEYEKWLEAEHGRLQEIGREKRGYSFLQKTSIKVEINPFVHQNQSVVRLKVIHDAINDTFSIWHNIWQNFHEEFNTSWYALQLRTDLWTASVNAFNDFYLTRERMELMAKQKFDGWIQQFMMNTSPENCHSVSITQQIFKPSGTDSDENQAR